MCRLYFLFVLFITMLSAEAALPYYFLQLNNEHGMINNQVKCVFMDSKGYMWFGTESGVSKYDGKVFKNHNDFFNHAGDMNNDYVSEIQEDQSAGIWFKTMHNYVIYDSHLERFYVGINDYLGSKFNESDIQEVYFDEQKQLWIKLYSNKYFSLYNPETKDVDQVFVNNKPVNCGLICFLNANGLLYSLFTDGSLECYDMQYQLQYSNRHLEGKLGNDSINAKLFVDRSGGVWFYGNNHGVYRFDAIKSEWAHYSTTSAKFPLSNDIVTAIAQDEEERIWIGTDHGGINVLDLQGEQVSYICHQEDNPQSVAQDAITDIFIDRKNMVWVSTYKQGVSFYNKSIYKFQCKKHFLSDPNSLPFNDVNCFQEDEKGNLWIGTNGGGLIYFNRKQGKYITYRSNPKNEDSLSTDVVVSLFIDSKGLLWVGTYAGGVNVFDGKKFKRYTVDNGSGLLNQNVWSIIEMSSGEILLGTLGGGLAKYNRSTDRIEALLAHNKPPFSVLSIYQLLRMRNGLIAIATDRGVAFYDAEKNRFESHLKEHREVLAKYVEGKVVNEIYEDSRSCLWYALRVGLFMLNPETGSYKLFREEDGFVEGTISCLLEDDDNNIWVSKSTGLSKISILQVAEDMRFEVSNFTEADGLQSLEFNMLSKCKTLGGELIFGGVNGFNLFRPEKIVYNQILPKVTFTELKVFNQTVHPKQIIFGCEVLKKSIGETKELVLKQKMNVFTINFSALDYFVPSKVSYEYQLEGFDKDWQRLGKNLNGVTYTNLDAGNYTFKVRAANSDGLRNESFSSIDIKILPPFYLSLWAIVCYVLLAASFLFWWRHSTLVRERLKLEIKNDRLQAERNHNLDEMKFKFLTNISHEFRTPLTLILTPIDKLLSKAVLPEDIKLITIVKNNAMQLLDLVNQLLDFRKLDLYELKYTPKCADLVYFLENLTSNFAQAFSKKNISFEFQHEPQKLSVIFDQDKLHKVMMNLLSNALKFTNEGGSVQVFLYEEPNDFIIRVVDTGVGISVKDQTLIFNRFYQSENNERLGVGGSGIGLNLAQEMVQLHNGSLSVESELNKGTIFTVRIPIEYESKEERKVMSNNDPINSNQSKQFTIMVVEDNADFRHFMEECLSEQYKVCALSNGQEALNQVHDVQPDLIISDVMMPLVDGLDLCKQLKSDIRTSHIPIILLTARTEDEDKIKGLEIGADEYITKPFNLEVLLLRVAKLISLRETRLNQFKQGIDVSPSEITITSMDEKLIKKAIALVEENIANSAYSVEHLSSDLGMSRVYLYKKLIAIVGKAPIEFIRIIRLKRAAQLLEKSQMNVSEVAYEVGFNSPRYFAKYFKEQYGVVPTQYMKDKSVLHTKD
ncbi:MAG: two-component regulator propeller domain-containing protein [Mangrovibacterium sp.]